MISKTKLSTNERKVITAVGGQADLSMVELSTFAGLPVHTFRYTLARLEEQRVIKKIWIIDTFQLGKPRHGIFFSLSPQSERSRTLLLNSLQRLKEVIFLQELGGDFDFEMSLIAASPAHALDILYALPDSAGQSFFSKAVSTRYSVAFFPRKYLASLKKYSPGLIIGGSVGTVELDQLDRDILTSMTKEPRWSRREMARHLKRPEPTIDLRVKKLYERKVIVGATFTTNASIYGAHSYKLLLYARGYDRTLRKNLFEFVQQHPHGTYFIECFGDWDFEVGVEVEDHAQLIAVREELARRFGSQLQAIRALTRLKVHKYSGYFG